MAARKKAAGKKEPGQAKPQKHKKKRTTAVPASERAAGKIRKTTHHKFTPAARKRYLENLAEWGTKERSADAAGVTYSCVRDYLATHPDFQAEVDEAIERYRDMLLNEVKERGVKGYVQQAIFGKEGQILGHKVVKSDRLLEVALKRVDPESRETINKVEHKGTMVTAKVPFDVKLLEKLDKEGREAMRTVIKQMGATDGATEPSPDSSKP